MASKAQIQSFVKRYADAANAASGMLHIPASYILGQWGMETAWGTQPNMGSNNPGNILRGGKPQNFSNINQFLSSYVDSMKHDFQYFTFQKYGLETGTPSIATIFGSKNRYDPTNPAYNANVQNGYNTLEKTLGLTGSSLENAIQTNFGNNPGIFGIKNPTTNIENALSTATNRVTGALQKIGFAVLSIAVFALGVYVLVQAEGKNMIKEVAKAA